MGLEGCDLCSCEYFFHVFSFSFIKKCSCGHFADDHNTVKLGYRK